MNSLIRIACVLSAVAALGACAHEPPAPVANERIVEVTAVVEAIDAATRMVQLRAPDGRQVAVKAGPEVRNFDQIQVGDELQVTYYEAMGVEVTTPEKATQGVQGDAAVVRAPQGSRPAGAVAETLTTTVTIESVEKSTNTVTFRRADGTLRSLVIENPKAQAFVRELKRGDMVQITYVEAAAVSVRPVGKPGA